MLELAILGLLKERPMHGYDLRKRMRGGFGLIGSLSFGSLYPALARLERDGAVREIEDFDDTERSETSATVIPLSGSLTGERAAFRARLAARAANAASAARASARGAGTRGRKVYELTPVGEELFASLLVAEGRRQDDDKSFVLRWSFARHMPADGRVRLLELQQRRLEDRLSAAERRRAQTFASLDVYERQIADHTIDSLARDLAWTRDLLATELSGAAAFVTKTPS